MPAKKSTKKTAKKAVKKVAKKAAKKTAKNKLATFDFGASHQEGSFDLLARRGNAGFGLTASRMLNKAWSRRQGKSIVTMSQSNVILDYLPIRSFYLQWCIDAIGIPKRSFIEVVGRDGLGKSSFFYWLIGGFMTVGCPAAYAHGESKIISPDWAYRLLHRDSTISEAMMDNIAVNIPSDYDELLQAIQSLIADARNPESDSFVPPHVPLIFVIDPINKIKTREEGSGGPEGGAKLSEVQLLADKGHTWDRAKYYHDISTRLSSDMTKLNYNVMIGSHQNDEAVGSAGGTKSFLPEYKKALAHRTKRGGQAMNQSVALQLVFAEKGVIYSDGEIIGKRVAIKPFKNSYGTTLRECFFSIKNENFDDNHDKVDPGLRWDLTTADWMASLGLMGMTVSNADYRDPRYSCSDLGLFQASTREAGAAVDRITQEQWADLGKRMKIAGYVDPLGDVLRRAREEAEEKARAAAQAEAQEPAEPDNPPQD